MQADSFHIDSALRFGWRTFRANFWLMVMAFVLMSIITSGLGWVTAFVSGLAEDLVQDIGDRSSVDHGDLVVGVALVIGVIVVCSVDIVVSAFTTLGYMRLTLRVVDGQQAAVADIFSCRRLLPRVVLGWVVYILIMLGGLVLLVLPGIIWAIRFQFFAYVIVDEDAGALESLRRSSTITRGETLNLLGFGVVCALISLAGMLALLVGALVAYPTVALADAYVYRRLSAKAAGRGMSAAAA